MAATFAQLWCATRADRPQESTVGEVGAADGPGVPDRVAGQHQRAHRRPQGGLARIHVRCAAFPAWIDLILMFQSDGGCGGGEVLVQAGVLQGRQHGGVCGTWQWTRLTLIPRKEKLIYLFSYYIQASKQGKSDREVVFVLAKAEDGPYWPRLTKDKIKARIASHILIVFHSTHSHAHTYDTHRSTPGWRRTLASGRMRTRRTSRPVSHHIHIHHTH